MDHLLTRTKGHIRYISQNKLDKACFQNDIAWDLKDLPRWAASDKLLGDKVFSQNLILLNIYKMTDISVYLYQWFTTFLIENLIILLVGLLNWNYIIPTISKRIAQDCY